MDTKYINIDGNQFICDDYYLSNVLNHTKKPYTKKSKLFEYRWINYPDKFEAIERNFIKQYIHKNDIVLELGGNIGVTSCLINNIVDEAHKSKHTVTENCEFILNALLKNKLHNRCQFGIVNGSLEKITDLQKTYHFNTIVSDIEGDEYQFIINNFDYISKYINTIIIEFHNKYFCKKRENISKTIINECHNLLNTQFSIINKQSSVFVYKKNE